MPPSFQIPSFQLPSFQLRHRRLPSLRSALALLLLCATVLCLAVPSSAQSERNLSPRDRHWLDAEVTYIISSEERKAFLSLHSDAERESFIKSFWDARNPDPHSDINTYQEEHYRRLAYVNANYGNPRYQDGWRTDMGRVYITLGAPKQTTTFHANANLRELEFWFYQSPTPALPSFFNVVFYKESPIEDYKLYSPNQDGPVKVVTNGGSRQDPKFALGLIRRSAGAQVARDLLSLIPAEPVDIDNPSPSLESDVLLSKIRGLADNPLSRHYVELNRENRRVTPSVFTGAVQSDLLVTTFRDDQGRPSLHFLMRQRNPDPSILSENKDHNFAYSFTLRADLLTAAGKPVYEQQEVLAGTLTADQAKNAAQRCFAGEGRLPVIPGAYTLAVTLTNDRTHEASQARKTVTVAAPAPGTLGISGLVAYASAPGRDPADSLPFSLSHVRFAPRGTENVVLHAGERLPLVFELWLDPAATTAGTPSAGSPPAQPRTLQLNYIAGSLTSASKAPLEESENLEASNLDAAGNFLTGHTLATDQLIPGNYRVVVKATDSASHRTASSSLNLQVVPAEAPSATWTAFGPPTIHNAANDDLKRGFAAAALKGPAEAEVWYRKALADDPHSQPALARVAETDSTLGDTARLASLGRTPAFEKPVDPKTVVLVADALRVSGDGKQALALVSSQLGLQPPTPELYRAQAAAYESTGDHRKAEEALQLAASVKPGARP